MKPNGCDIKRRTRISITALALALLLLLPGLLNPVVVSDERGIEDRLKVKDPPSDSEALPPILEDYQLIVLTALEEALGSAFISWKVKIEVKDVNGNTQWADEKVEGVLTKIWKAIKAVIDAIISFFNWLLNQVLKILKAVWNAVIAALKAMIETNH
jgi:hypothetical protein